MDPLGGASWEVTGDDKDTDWRIRITVGRGEPYSYLYDYLPYHGVKSADYLIQVSAFLVILSIFGCFYYFAYVRRRSLKPELVPKEEPAEEPAAAIAEAKMNAALAARWRQEAFDKSGAEAEARKVAADQAERAATIAARKKAEFAKPWPRRRGKDDSPLKWHAGSATQRGFI